LARFCYNALFFNHYNNIFMQQIFLSAAFFAAMCSATTVSAQDANRSQRNFIAVLASGGSFEFAPPFTDYVTVKKLDGAGTITPVGTIFTQSVQAVAGLHGTGNVAVAAEDSLVFFDVKDDFSYRIGAFKIPDLYASFHSLYATGFGFPSTLWAGKWYGSNANFLFYYNNSFGPGYGGTVAGISHDVRGMAQIGDTLYVSQNIQNVQYQDSVSYIAKVLTSNKTLQGEMGRTNQALFLGVSELFNYNEKLYGVCLNSNRIIEYNPANGVKRTILCATGAITKTLSLEMNRLTVVQNDEVKRFDIVTGQLIENLTCLVITGESVVSGIDGVNTRNFSYPNGTFKTMLSTTDFTSFGKTYIQQSGCMANTANTGIAPEAMAIVTFDDLPTDNKLDNSLVSLSPNPTSDRLNITTNADIQGDITIKITDMMGRTAQSTIYGALPSQISLADLPKGLYFVQIQSEKGFFVQKVERL
jgi:Secretion system C-terminal sorting domain